jgi:hypothetical protein
MLIKNKDQRPSMPEVAAELAELSAQTPPPARRRPTNSMPVIPVITLERSGASTLAPTAAGQTRAALLRRLGLAAVAVTAALLIAGGLRVGMRPPPVATPAGGATPAPAPAPPTVPTPAETTPDGDKLGSGAVKGGSSAGTAAATAIGGVKKGKRKTILRSIHAKGGRQIED